VVMRLKDVYHKQGSRSVSLMISLAPGESLP